MRRVSTVLAFAFVVGCAASSPPRSEPHAAPPSTATDCKRSADCGGELVCCTRESKQPGCMKLDSCGDGVLACVTDSDCTGGCPTCQCLSHDGERTCALMAAAFGGVVK